MSSNTLKLTLLHRPFDTVSAPLATLPFFSDIRPLRHSAGLVDWRFNGEISHLIEEARLKGVSGEALLIPARGRLHSENLILYGLGERASWDLNQAESSFQPWIEKLERFKKNKWLLSFAGLTDDYRGWRQCVRAFVNALLHREDPPGCRHLMLTESADWVLEAKKNHMEFGENVSLNFDLSAA